jgi:hypothetical protein
VVIGGGGGLQTALNVVQIDIHTFSFVCTIRRVEGHVRTCHGDYVRT